MKTRPMAIALAIFTFSLVHTASGATFDPVMQILVSDDSDRDFLSDVMNPGPLADDGDIVVRERANLGQDDLQIRPFIQFDVSSLTPDTVSAPGFAAIFTVDFVTRLNTVNDMAVLVGRVLDDGVDGDAWGEEEGDLPLFEWARDGDEPGEDLPGDPAVLIENVKSDALGTYSADVTPIVQDWVNGEFENNGFVLFGSGDIFQGAGLNAAQLVTRILGDFDENGTVNGADFDILSGNLAGELDGPITAQDGDMDLDGDVDLDDFGVFKELFPAVQSQAVPEPSAGFILLGSLLGLIAMRRRR